MRLPDQWERQSVAKWTNIWKQLQVEISTEKRSSRVLRWRSQGTLTSDWEGRGRLFWGSGIRGERRRSQPCENAWKEQFRHREQHGQNPLWRTQLALCTSVRRTGGRREAWEGRLRKQTQTAWHRESPTQMDFIPATVEANWQSLPACYSFKLGHGVVLCVAVEHSAVELDCSSMGFGFAS